MTPSRMPTVDGVAKITPGPPDQDERDQTQKLVDDLLRRMRAHKPGSAQRQRLREQVIRVCLPMAERLVRRYRDRGEPLEDLNQVAALSLINAVDRYDPEIGESFLAFAIPTILGEVRRHFRDRTWSLHVPRRYQELRGQLAEATEQLAQQLRRRPTTGDLAEHLGTSDEEIIEAAYAARCHDALSLDGAGARGREMLANEVGSDDDNYERAEAHVVVLPALRQLPKRERRILYLRFFGELTQTEIAEQVGLSQMHVSRLIRDSLQTLRGSMAV